MAVAASYRASPTWRAGKALAKLSLPQPAAAAQPGVFGWFSSGRASSSSKASRSHAGAAADPMAVLRYVRELEAERDAARKQQAGR